MLIKVKNNLGKKVKIKLLDNSEYVLQKNDEKIIGTYDECLNMYIYDLLKIGLNISKIEEAYANNYERLDTKIDDSKMSSDENIIDTIVINNKDEEIKSKKKKGRPKKSK